MSQCDRLCKGSWPWGATSEHEKGSPLSETVAAGKLGSRREMAAHGYWWNTPLCKVAACPKIKALNPPPRGLRVDIIGNWTKPLSR